MPESILKQASILIVDDERANVRFLEIVLQRAGYDRVFSTMDPCQVLSLCLAVQPDMILLDLHMPGHRRGDRGVPSRLSLSQP